MRFHLALTIDMFSHLMPFCVDMSPHYLHVLKSNNTLVVTFPKSISQDSGFSKFLTHKSLFSEHLHNNASTDMSQLLFPPHIISKCNFPSVCILVNIIIYLVSYLRQKSRNFSGFLSYSPHPAINSSVNSLVCLHWKYIPVWFSRPLPPSPMQIYHLSPEDSLTS